LVHQLFLAGCAFSEINMKARRICSVPIEIISQKSFRSVSRLVPQVILTAAVAFVSAESLYAQDSNEINQLKQQLREMRENFEKVQNEQRQQIDALTKKLEELTKEKAAEAEKKKLADQLAAELATTNQPATAPSSAPAMQPATSWSPSEPITIARAGSAYMNLSFDALMDVGWSTASDPSQYLQLGDHDPIKRGFTMPNAEIALDGAVDPYFKGFANIVLKLDKDNQTEVELEEAYLLTTALPFNLQAKAGQFFAAFGRQNPQHPHQWAFVDAPIILTRAFGPEGLRNLGGQLSWLAPTPFYTEASIGVFDGQGSTAFSFRNPGEPVGGVNRFHGRETLDRELRGPGDLLYVPRVSSSFDLSESQTLVAGASAAFGPNETGSDRHTQIYGTDLYWKWKPAHADAGFPFVSLQAEALYQLFEAGADTGAGLPQETLRDWGFYSQVLWGFKPRWVAGLRGEWVDGNTGAFDAEDVFRGQRTRVSPNITFYPSEFSKIRLQYNYDHGEHFGDEHSIWLQIEFLLGAHGAHKF
jgi:hypothetical protein